MPKFGFFLCFFAIAFSASAQIGGRHTYQFLNLVSSPKQAALGGKNITGYSYDPSSALYNPSTINAEMEKNLSLNYVSYLGDVNFGNASYAFSLGPKAGTLHTGVTYINYGKFDGYDEFGNETGSFTGNEVAVSAGYKYTIPNSDFHVGANLKVITSKLEQYTSFGLAADIGVSYVNQDKKLIVSGVLRNAGSQLRPYDEIYESIPLELDFGISQQPENLPIRWHLTLENMQKWNLAFRNKARDKEDLEGNVTKDNPGFFNNVFRHTVMGVEFFPEGNFNIRVGYSFRRGEELRIEDQRAFSGLSGGFQVKIKRFRLAYTYARYNAAASANLIGLNIDLNNNPE